MDNNRLITLLTRYRDNACSPEELQEIEQWYQALDSGNRPAEITDAFAQEMLRQFRERLGSPVVPFYKRKLFRVAAAAAVLLLVASGAYFLFAPRQGHPSVVQTEEQAPVNDVAPPVTNKATLTLANGKVIVIDSAGIGSLAESGAANASKVNEGELAYAANTATVVEYHTLNVPRGSKPIQLQLSDGTEVWLNAASGIRFPNVFTGNERKVTMTGEAYFEVAKHEGKKFLVEAGGTTTEVLGTHFNINAYPDEKEVKVTLLEGSIKVNNAAGSAMLKPGQQARLTLNLKPETLNHANLEEVMAWKNGRFEFNETDIQAIMRQIARWYDVEVVFEGTVTQHFNGTIPRQVNASKVLNMLEKTGGVRFSIEGKKVIVKKY